MKTMCHVARQGSSIANGAIDDIGCKMFGIQPGLLILILLKICSTCSRIKSTIYNKFYSQLLQTGQLIQ